MSTNAENLVKIGLVLSYIIADICLFLPFHLKNSNLSPCNLWDYM